MCEGVLFIFGSEIEYTVKSHRHHLLNLDNYNINHDADVESTPLLYFFYIGYNLIYEDGDEQMRMKIGEFAAFCDISVRALHLYDRIGLFKPAYVDDNSGYRYYLPKQMQELNTIISYRKVGFSLQDIRELMSDDIDKKDAVEKLRAKQIENNNIAAICQYNNEIIQAMLDALAVPAKKESEHEAALRLSRIACLENEKLEHEFSQILWL